MTDVLATTQAPAAEADPLREPRVRRLLLSLAIAFGLAAFLFAFGDLARDLDYALTISTLRHLPSSALALALAMTFVSFAGIVAREATALAYVGAHPPRLAIALCGVAAAALGNVAGFGMLTGAAVRYRIYGAVGVGALDVARVVGFIMVSFAIGVAAVGGGAALLRAPQLATMFHCSPGLVQSIAGVALAGVGVLLALGARALPGLSRTAPRRGLIALQTLWTAIRLLGAAAALWALLPAGSIGLVSFVPLFVAATALGVLLHIPAGAGVLELLVLWSLRAHAPRESVAAALIAYRAIYYVLPLLLSAGALAAFEWRIAFDPAMPRADARLARAATRLTPTFVGVVAFAIGVLLLVSGATPVFDKRLHALAQHVPLWATEASSLFGSVLGVAFLFLARGLFDRRDGAWRLAVVASLASLAFALLKGLAFGEAALLAAFLLLLMATRRSFPRATSLFDQPFTWGWLVAVGAILAAAFGVLWLAFQSQPSPLGNLSSFAFDAQAPRALRAMLGACIAAGGFGLWQLLRPPPGRAAAPDAPALARALGVIEAQPHGEAMMALMGDKALMFSASGRAFLMYGKRGRSWIALYDPIGPREDWRELVERFVNLAAEHGGRANVYQSRPEHLSFYLDLGFSATKLGEEALIDLSRFTLKGGAFTNLRYALKRGERDGLAFELLEPDAASARIDDLAAISNDWLEARRGEEKGFSVAAFDVAYLARQRIGLVREAGRPVAFASVMTTPAGREATLGLLRVTETQSPVTMEFLVTRLAMALRDQGFSRFSLGAAPLAGVGSAPLPTRWSRLARFVWRHGDRFYRFQGLRAFKNKFHPDWEPRYLVTSGVFGPFVALADAVALIGAGSGKVAGTLDV